MGTYSLVFHCEWHSKSNKVTDLLKTLSHFKGRCFTDSLYPLQNLCCCAKSGFDLYSSKNQFLLHKNSRKFSLHSFEYKNFNICTTTGTCSYWKSESIFIINDYSCSCYLEIWFCSVQFHGFYCISMLSLNWQRVLFSSHFSREGIMVYSTEGGEGRYGELVHSSNSIINFWASKYLSLSICFYRVTEKKIAAIFT